MTSRTTVFAAPNGWVGEIVSLVTRAGFVQFEYELWRSQRDKDNGEEPFLLNNHKAQRRERQQRVVKDVTGKYLHRGNGTTTIAIDPEELEEFLAIDARASRWVSDTKRLDEWEDQAGRKLAPFVFPSYFDVDEPLDPQWVREEHFINLEDEVEQLIFQYITRAEAKKWEGDRRGTTLNLQVGASADDAHQATDGSVVITGTAFTVDATSEWHGFRWQNVTIANADTIDNAILSVHIPLNNGDEPLHRLWGEDTDDAAQFAAGGAGSSTVSARATTTATVDWNDTDVGANDTFEQWGAATSGGAGSTVESIVQEIVNRAGWASGNDLVMVDTQSSSDALRDLNISFYDDEGSTNAAKLDIDYTGAATTAPPPRPMVNRFVSRRRAA